MASAANENAIITGGDDGKVVLTGRDHQPENDCDRRQAPLDRPGRPRNPYLVEQDAAVAWKTALWYWNTQTGPGTMTPHQAMVNGAGFGETIRSINGSIECNGGNPGQVQSRIDSYKRFVEVLGTTPGDNLSC